MIKGGVWKNTEVSSPDRLLRVASRTYFAFRASCVSGCLLVDMRFNCRPAAAQFCIMLPVDGALPPASPSVLSVPTHR